MRVRIAGRTRAWVQLFEDSARSDSWMHSGVAISDDGAVVVAAPEGNAVVRLAADGSELSRWPTPTTELHGITRDEIDGREVFWVADNGHKYVPAEPFYADRRVDARLLALDASGNVVRELLAPDHPAYADRGWSPTAIAVEGTGDQRRIWVADGYGASLVHVFDAAGRHRLTVDGSDTGLAFDCPHGLVIDPRGATEVIVVADRANQRLVELDLDGRARRVLGEGALWSPSGLAIDADLLLVTELWGDLVVLDADGGVIDRFDPQSTEPERPGWPNTTIGGVVARPDLVRGTWNSPHGIAVDPADGSWIVTEWLIGGRVTRLVPADDDAREN